MLRTAQVPLFYDQALFLFSEQVPLFYEQALRLCYGIPCNATPPNSPFEGSLVVRVRIQRTADSGLLLCYGSPRNAIPSE